MKQLCKHIVIRIIRWQAQTVLQRRKPRIAAVIGSVGKTSTKDAVATVLASETTVRKSKKSYNSEIGVPLTILGCESAWGSAVGWIGNIVKGFMAIVSPAAYSAWLVLELGVDRPSDSKRLSSWIKPDIAIVTRLGANMVHQQFFSTRQELVDEKRQLVSAVKKDGSLILNYDDKEVAGFGSAADARVLYYGFDNRADVFASNEMIEYQAGEMFTKPIGLSIKVNYNGSSVPIVIDGAVGKQQIYPVLAAFAVGISLEMNMVTVSQAISRHVTPPGRMRLLDGLKQTTIIDDSYNSSPVAAFEALETLRSIHTVYRRIAVLGDMEELGEDSESAHQELGRYAGEVCDMLFTVGPLARQIAASARSSGMPDDAVYEFDNPASAGEALEHVIEPGDTILVKASQSIRAERVVEEIMNEPDRAGELLVRQEPEWKKR